MPQRPSDPRAPRPAQPEPLVPYKPSEPENSPSIAGIDRAPATPVNYAARVQLAKSLYARRTLIPIMLTLGVLFCLLGLGQWMTDPDYPFAAENMMWAAIALPGVGVALLVMAVINMLSVRNALRRGAI